MKKTWLNVTVPTGCAGMTDDDISKTVDKYTKYFTKYCVSKQIPHAIVATGMPGSGKSTIVTRFLRRGYSFANPDIAVELLPQYKDGLTISKKPLIGSTRMRMDCIDIGYKIYSKVISKSVAKRYNIIIDMPYAYEEIHNLAKNGYRITLVYVVGDVKRNTERIIKRAYKTGMFLNPTEKGMKQLFKREKYSDIKESLPYYMPFVDEIIICDNRGTKPKCQTFQNYNKTELISNWKNILSTVSRS